MSKASSYSRITRKPRNVVHFAPAEELLVLPLRASDPEPLTDPHRWVRYTLARAHAMARIVYRDFHGDPIDPVECMSVVLGEGVRFGVMLRPVRFCGHKKPTRKRGSR